MLWVKEAYVIKVTNNTIKAINQAIETLDTTRCQATYYSGFPDK